VTAAPAPEPGYALDAGGELLIHEPSRPLLRRLGLTSLAAVFALEAEQRTKQKSLARLPCAGQTVFVKRWEFDRREVWLKATLKGGNHPVFSGPQELRNLCRLRAAGLRAPLPLLAGEEDQGWRRRSFVALTQLQGQPWDALGVPAPPEARRQRATELASMVAQLHRAGFWHKDLYLCNVYWDISRGLGLLDCERVDHDPRGVPTRWLIKDLAALDSSAQGWTCSDRLRFLRAYLGVERLDAAGKELARDVRAKARRMTRHGAKT
jgi:tRNA A-37 threonylcarbamoyl transferase component Bud32